MEFQRWQGLVAALTNPSDKQSLLCLIEARRAIACLSHRLGQIA